MTIRRAGHSPLVDLETAVGCGYDCSSTGELAVHRVYRLKGWPPRKRVRCRGEWRNFDGVQGPWSLSTRRGNICLDKQHDAGLRAVLVRQFRTDHE